MTLVCGRCGLARPAVCSACGPAGSPTCDPACSRLREEIEAAANRPAVLVTGDDATEPMAASESTSAPRRCCTASSAPTRSPSSTSIASCWRRATERASRRWRCWRGRRGWSARAAGAGGSSCRRSCRSIPSSVPPCEPIPAGWSTDERGRRRMLGLATVRRLGRDLRRGQRRVRRQPARVRARHRRRGRQRVRRQVDRLDDLGKPPQPRGSAAWESTPDRRRSRPLIDTVAR